MAKLSLLDAFGVDGSGSLKPNARLQEIIPEFLDLRTISLDQVPFASAQSNLTFKQPIDVSVAGLSLSIGAGVSGCIQVLGAEKRAVDRDDPFGQIGITHNEIYLGLTLEFSSTGGASIHVSPLAFGVSADQKLTVNVYRRFLRSDSGAFPEFGVSLAQTLQAFLVPQTPADFDSLDDNTILVVAGVGQLKLSTSVSIEAPVRQLVATSPIAGKAIQVNAAANFTVGFSSTLAGAYQSRLRRLPASQLEIGIYKSRSLTLTAQLSAEAGIAADVGRFDLAEKFAGALSRNPLVDVSEFTQALPGEDPTSRDLQIEAFQKKLGDAISTTISANVTASLSSLRSNESVLTFEVSHDSLSSAVTSAALTAALSGDFKALTQSSSSLPPGVKQTSNIFTRSDVAKHKLSINLLGLVNFVSIGKLARISEVDRNEAGEITCVTDTADANRLQAVLFNITRGDIKRLRALLSEDFLFQASFKTTGLKILSPDFSAKHTFFELNNNTDAKQMKNLLDVCRVMKLLTPAEEADRLKTGDNFGRTTFWLQTIYTETNIEQTFLSSDGSPRSQDEFETQGRSALGELLSGDEGQQFRKLIADTGPEGSAIWRAMKRDGDTANFNRYFGLPLDAKDPRVNAAAADFLCISSWANAMCHLGEAIAEVRASAAELVDSDEDRRTVLHQKLLSCMAAVVKNSGEHFGDPLGLVMVYLASGSSAGARVIAGGSSIPQLTKSVAPNALTTRAGA